MAAAGATPAAAQTGTIQGRVTDSTGAVIVGAMFTVDGSGARGTSTARGRYALGGVPAGRRIMRVRALGFSPESIAVNVTASPVTELDVV
ncbi:MAG TPA: carboxypeptidase-like regulatory domain-containing protein, partial [Gemmatimonadaceae bacterium]|nr:carboxypeptidase-like regulatory domain-containing protein [Gemmatimonadaceae bacterium]